MTRGYTLGAHHTGRSEDAVTSNMKARGRSHPPERGYSEDLSECGVLKSNGACHLDFSFLMVAAS